MHMRSLRAAALIATATLLVASCGGGGGGGGGGNSDQAAEGTPTLTIWTGDSQVKGMKETAAKWGQDNGVNIVLQAVPGPNLQTNFVTAAQAGKGPDLVMGAHDYIGNFVQNGTVEPIQLTEEAKAGFLPQAVKGVTFNGQVYAVPYAVENVVLFRNTSLVPEAPKTIDEMVEIGKGLQAEGKVSEILALPVGQNGDAYHSYPIYTSGGGYLFGVDDKGNYDPADLGVAKPEAIKAFEKFTDLARRAKAP